MPADETFETRLFGPYQDAFPPPSHVHPGHLVVRKPALGPEHWAAAAVAECRCGSNAGDPSRPCRWAVCMQGTAGQQGSAPACTSAAGTAASILPTQKRALHVGRTTHRLRRCLPLLPQKQDVHQGGGAACLRWPHALCGAWKPRLDRWLGLLPGERVSGEEAAGGVVVWDVRVSTLPHYS